MEHNHLRAWKCHGDLLGQKRKIKSILVIGGHDKLVISFVYKFQDIVQKKNKAIIHYVSIHLGGIKRKRCCWSKQDKRDPTKCCETWPPSFPIEQIRPYGSHLFFIIMPMVHPCSLLSCLWFTLFFTIIKNSTHVYSPQLLQSRYVC